jgi:hypothetical protein
MGILSGSISGANDRPSPSLQEEPCHAHPAKNRLHDYEAGWLTLLVEMGVATKEQANEAMCRVAQAAIDEMNEQRERRRARRGRKEP